jgi:predicted nucleic acid-binding protein
VRSLLDTNILIHADAADEPRKQQRAIELITAMRGAGTAVLSTQVLQEYVNVALRNASPAARTDPSTNRFLSTVREGCRVGESDRRRA